MDGAGDYVVSEELCPSVEGGVAAGDHQQSADSVLFTMPDLLDEILVADASHTLGEVMDRLKAVQEHSNVSVLGRSMPRCRPQCPTEPTCRPACTASTQRQGAQV